MSSEKYEEDESFYYLEKGKKAYKTVNRLSIHSPDFKKYIEDVGNKQYKVISFDNNYDISEIDLPENLNKHTVEIPNFISNDCLLFMTEDKIIKCYNYEKKQEEFIVSHCDFPGSQGEIDLATLLEVGNHIIGENVLTYERVFKQVQTEKGKLPER